MTATAQEVRQDPPGETPPRPGRSFTTLTGPFAHAAAALGALVALWFLVTDGTGLAGPEFLPSPADVVREFGSLLMEPYSGTTLFGHVAMSLQRWGLGVLFAVLLGVPLGILLAWLPPARAAITPIFELLRYIPPFAWIPIAVLWFGASLEAQAAIVFVAAFPVCVTNSQIGVGLADPLPVQAARSLGSGQLRTLTRIILPDALPLIFTGMRTATSNGWMALVGAELVVGKQGLGFLIAQGQVNGSTATIVVGMITIGIIGSLFDFGMQRTQALLMPWQPLRAGGK